MTLDDLVIKELGRAQLQAMRDALEKQALKQEIATLKLAVEQAQPKPEVPPA